MPTILVVDDSSTMRHYIGNLLRKAGFDVLVAEDGQAGLEALHAHPEVAGIVVDVHMPRLGGIDMIDSFVAGGTLGIPTFVLTAESGSPHVDRARALGVAGWFVKPFRGEELVDAMRAAIGG